MVTKKALTGKQLLEDREVEVPISAAAALLNCSASGSGSAANRFSYQPPPLISRMIERKTLEQVIPHLDDIEGENNPFYHELIRDHLDAQMRLRKSEGLLNC